MEALFEKIQNSFYINLVFENRYLFLLNGFVLTLFLTGATFLVGTILGAFFCRIRLGRSRFAKKLVELISTLFIRLPTLVLLLIFVYLLFSGTDIDTTPLAILAFSMKTGSYISYIFFSAYNAVNKGEVEAGRTLGMSRIQVFMSVTFPQIIRFALPTYKNQLIITLQETSLVGFFAMNDLTRASQVITSRTMDPYISLIITAAAYLLIGSLSNFLFKFLERNRHLKEGKDYFISK